MKATIGIALVILAFLVSLYPYMLLYMIPVYITGVILIWLSDVKVMTKAMFTFLPIAFWYPGSILLGLLLGQLAL